MNDILLIALICVLVTDKTDFFSNVEKMIYKVLHPERQPRELHLKLLRCSLCQTWWCSLVYLIITGNVTLFNLAYALFIAFLTPVIGDLLEWVRDILYKFIKIIYKITE